jgi:hypothetical protein
MGGSTHPRAQPLQAHAPLASAGTARHAGGLGPRPAPRAALHHYHRRRPQRGTCGVQVQPAAAPHGAAAAAAAAVETRHRARGADGARLGAGAGGAVDQARARHAGVGCPRHGGEQHRPAVVVPQSHGRRRSAPAAHRPHLAQRGALGHGHAHGVDRKAAAAAAAASLLPPEVDAQAQRVARVVGQQHCHPCRPVRSAEPALASASSTRRRGAAAAAHQPPRDEPRARVGPGRGQRGGRGGGPAVPHCGVVDAHRRAHPAPVRGEQVEPHQQARVRQTAEYNSRLQRAPRSPRARCSRRQHRAEAPTHGHAQRRRVAAAPSLRAAGALEGGAVHGVPALRRVGASAGRRAPYRAIAGTTLAAASSQKRQAAVAVQGEQAVLLLLLLLLSSWDRGEQQLGHQHPAPAMPRTTTHRPRGCVSSSTATPYTSWASCRRACCRRAPAPGHHRQCYLLYVRTSPGSGIAIFEYTVQRLPVGCCFFIHTHKPKNNDCLSSLPN